MIYFSFIIIIFHRFVLGLSYCFPSFLLSRKDLCVCLTIQNFVLHRYRKRHLPITINLFCDDSVFATVFEFRRISLQNHSVKILVHSIGLAQGIYSCRIVSESFLHSHSIYYKNYYPGRLCCVYSLFGLVFGLLKFSLWENFLSKSSPLELESFSYHLLLLDFSYSIAFPFTSEL